MVLIFISLAPIILIVFYIYLRDKYEKEPIKMLLWALLAGGIITIPVYFIEVFLSNFSYIVGSNKFAQAAYDGFVVASFTEETLKFIALYILIWGNVNFNEKFDGIVYAVFVSLGFAAVENLLYVFVNGMEVGILRAVTAVPAHALFGVSMGYHLAMAKFIPRERVAQLIKSLLVPIILHGAYDFILMSENNILLILFFPFVIYLWIVGFKRMRSHSDDSVFKTT